MRWAIRADALRPPGARAAGIGWDVGLRCICGGNIPGEGEDASFHYGGETVVERFAFRMARGWSGGSARSAAGRCRGSGDPLLVSSRTHQYVIFSQDHLQICDWTKK